MFPEREKSSEVSPVSASAFSLEVSKDLYCQSAEQGWSEDLGTGESKDLDCPSPGHRGG